MVAEKERIIIGFIVNIVQYKNAYRVFQSRQPKNISFMPLQIVFACMLNHV